MSLDVDVLVLAGINDVVTADNYKDIKAKIILELANGPVDGAAHRELEKRNIVSIPDILANAGGVVVSYLEWCQNKNNEHWPLSKVNGEMERIMLLATTRLLEHAKKAKISLRGAAYELAIERLLTD